MVWFGVVCSGMRVVCVTHSDDWFGVIWSSEVFCGVVRCSVEWSVGGVRYNDVWGGVRRSGVVLCYFV